MQNDSYSDEIDLFELVATLWSEKWKIIFAALVVGGLGGGFAVQGATFSVSLPVTIQVPLPVKEQLVITRGAFPEFEQSMVGLGERATDPFTSRFSEISTVASGESSDPAGELILLSAQVKKETEEVLSELTVEVSLALQRIESEIENEIRRAQIEVQTFQDTLDPVELKKNTEYAAAVSRVAVLRSDRASLQNLMLVSSLSTSAWNDWVMVDEESPQIKPLRRPEIYTVLGVILGGGLGVLFVLISKAVRERRSSGF